MVFCFYRPPAAGITKRAHMNVSVTLYLSFPDQLTFKPVKYPDCGWWVWSLPGDQVVNVGLGSEMQWAMGIQLILQLQVLVSLTFSMTFTASLHLCHL